MIIRHPFLRAMLIFLGSWVVAVVVLLGLYFAWLRDWQMNWGASSDEVARVMPGDELFDDPTFNATRAVEIAAPPEAIWPWLVQIGYKRAGFYAFDRLDNAGIPSAERILPEFQDLKVGDSISLGGIYVNVREMIPDSLMLWVFLPNEGPWNGATWSWGLYRVDDRHTRLVARLRQDYALTSLPETIRWGLLDATEIFMMRTCLLGVKHRVEGGT
ncbi:MAG TPA: hypothetical protein VM118_04340 [Acidobacteriota bacterium]|nr:hypothetical protein [Acidobacteriota bacterium]